MSDSGRQAWQPKTREEKLESYLRQALRAIPRNYRTDRKYLEVDEAAGSTWEETLKPWFKEAVELIGDNPETYY